MDNKRIVTLLFTSDNTEKSTNQIKEIINEFTNNGTSSLIYEFNSKSYYEELKLNEDKLKEANIYLGQSLYVEDIINDIRKYKKKNNIDVLMIDGLDLVQTQEKYCLGRSDIVSIIYKQLKQSAQELNISIIATAQEDIDDVYVLDMDIIQKLNDYEFSNQVKKELIDYCNSKPSVGKDYILSVAESWHKNNIKTEEDLDNYLKKYEILDEINTKISKIIERPTNEYEKLYVEKWIYKNKIDEKKLIELVKSNRTNFDRIDKIISNKN